MNAPTWAHRRAQDARQRVSRARAHRDRYGYINQMSAALYQQELREAEIAAGYAEHDVWLLSQ